MVDSGTSMHLIGISSLNYEEKNAFRNSSENLDVETTNDIVVSDTQARVYIKELGAYLWYIWWKILRQCFRWKL